MAFEYTPSVNRHLLSTYWALAEHRGSKPWNMLTTLLPPFHTADRQGTVTSMCVWGGWGWGLGIPLSLGSEKSP